MLTQITGTNSTTSVATSVNQDCIQNQEFYLLIVMQIISLLFLNISHVQELYSQNISSKYVLNSICIRGKCKVHKPTIR